MLATQTSPGTWIAIATLVVMLVPIYVLTLNASKAYGRLEQKVDAAGTTLADRSMLLSNLSIETTKQSAQLNVISQSLVTQTTALTVLTTAFQAHQIQDAESFATLKGRLPDSSSIAATAAEAAAQVLEAARQSAADIIRTAAEARHADPVVTPAAQAVSVRP